MAGKWEEKIHEFGITAKTYQPTGNHASDKYREEILRSLEEEAQQFKGFLDKLRMAKDKAEFEQFTTERKSNGSASSTSKPSSGAEPSASPA